LTLVDVVAVPLNVRAVIVLVDGLTLTVDTVDVAAPETDVVAGVNIIGWLVLVVAVITLTFWPVVAKPVMLPENAPLNVVAEIVPLDGFTNTVDTVEVAAPATDVVAGVNIIGWFADVVAVIILTF
jgi:predicted metal-binding membrane protein